MTLAANHTVGEIAAQVPGATREFEKLGIDYCCGGSRTLGEACAAINLPLDETLARLQQGLAAPAPENTVWQTALLADLIEHIKTTHHVFVRAECPRIKPWRRKSPASMAANIRNSRRCRTSSPRSLPSCMCT
jgi:regulator of cell morphogenesis and NO signaling